ncbi:MAG: hypothetical protein ACRD6W_00225, partial [Nitrososphaerales archaeon]
MEDTEALPSPSTGGGAKTGHEDGKIGRTPSSRRRTRWLRTAVMLAALGVTVGLPALASASTRNKPTAHKLTAVQRGKNYYRGKTITLVSPDKPGGGFDQWSRLVAPALGAYLHATVNVSNIPAGNTIAGQDDVAKAKANGLTVGWVNAGPDIEDTILKLPALNFNPVREAFLGATAPGQTAILVLNTSACAKYDSFASLIENSKSSPVSEVLQTAGTGTFFILMVNEAFGIHYRALTGYASTADQVQGFTRGDGCLTEMPAATAAPLVTAGKARALALSVPLQKVAAINKDFTGVRSIAQEAKT